MESIKDAIYRLSLSLPELESISVTKRGFNRLLMELSLTAMKKDEEEKPFLCRPGAPIMVHGVLVWDKDEPQAGDD